MKSLKKSLIASLLVVGFGISGAVLGVGCTSAQVQTAETDIAKVLQAADNALAAVANNPAAIAQAETWLATLATIAPQTGPIHQAIIGAQAALVAVQKNQGTIATVQPALQTVINLLESNGTIPAGVVHRNPISVAPVGSK